MPLILGEEAKPQFSFVAMSNYAVIWKVPQIQFPGFVYLHSVKPSTEMRGKPEFELLELLWESLRTFKFVYEVEFPKDILKTFLSMSIVRYCSTHSVSRNRRVLSPLLSQARLPHTWNFSGSLLALSSSLLFSAFLVPHCVLFPLCSFQPFLAPGPSVLLCSVPWTQRAQQGLTSWAGFCVGKWPHPGAPSSSVFLRLWSWSHNI